jgi:hypothetical protein
MSPLLVLATERSRISADGVALLAMWYSEQHRGMRRILVLARPLTMRDTTHCCTLQVEDFDPPTWLPSNPQMSNISGQVLPL